MLSRVANSIYWMSRYVERAESVARFIDVNLELSLDFAAAPEEQWHPLVVTTGDEALFRARHERSTRASVIDFLTLDRDNPNSIVSCLAAARENARSVREVISSEMWQHLNRFYLMLRDADLDLVLQEAHGFFNEVRSSGQSFGGVTDATMTHGEAWHFGRMGRFIERADKTSRILDVKYFLLLPSPHDVGSPLDEVQWGALLRSASAFEMYRQRHGPIGPDRIVEFLVLDREFPRAVLYCLTRANESLHAVTGAPLGTFSNGAEQALGQLRSELAYARAGEIIQRGLHEFIDDLQVRLNGVGGAIHETFFAVRPVGSRMQSA